MKIGMRRGCAAFAAGVTLIVYLVANPVQAFELTSDQDIHSGVITNSGGLGGSAESIISSSGTGTRSSPYLFDWSNADGAGSPASPGLNLDRFKIYDHFQGNTKSFILNLNGGNITGDTSNAAIAFSTVPEGTSSYYPGHITIRNVANVIMGRTRTSRWASDTDPSGNTAGGNLTIGRLSERAANVFIGSVDTHGDSMGGGRTAGHVSIYATGFVTIGSQAGPSDVLAYNTRGINRCGDIIISHDGKLTAGILDTGSQKGYSNPAGAITLDGDALNNQPSGQACISSIITGNADAVYGGNVFIEGYAGLTISGGIVTCAVAGNSGHVAITNITGSVTVGGGIRSANMGSAEDSSAGDVWIHCARHIRIGGVIDLSHSGGGGQLVLVTTSVGTYIRLKDLDLAKCGSAALTSGGLHSIIKGALLSFPVDAPDSGKLDTPDGHLVHYDRSVPANAYLLRNNGGVYVLKSGGILTPALPPGAGTVVFFK